MPDSRGRRVHGEGDGAGGKPQKPAGATASPSGRGHRARRGPSALCCRHPAVAATPCPASEKRGGRAGSAAQRVQGEGFPRRVRAHGTEHGLRPFRGLWNTRANRRGPWAGRAASAPSHLWKA